MNQDINYKEFTSKLIPTIDSKTMIGVRSPIIKKIGKEFFKRKDNLIHSYLLTNEREYQKCLKDVKQFLPYIDNWAVCDSLTPKSFKKHKKELEKEIEKWISSKKTYTIRFGIKMYMSFYLEEDFKRIHLEKVSKIQSKEYYVNMMIAWYFATALAKQYKDTIIYIENQKLDTWIHNKTIQKAIESYRISDSQKEYLKSLK